MKLDSKYFEKILCGEKTIEMRLWDEKRQKIKVGDFIEFTDRANFRQMMTIVVGLHKFRNFTELYAHFDKSKLGYDRDEAADPHDMAQFYTQQDIDQYGVVGIEVRLS